MPPRKHLALPAPSAVAVRPPAATGCPRHAVHPRSDPAVLANLRDRIQNARTWCGGNVQEAGVRLGDYAATCTKTKNKGSTNDAARQHSAPLNRRNRGNLDSALPRTNSSCTGPGLPGRLPPVAAREQPAPRRPACAGGLHGRARLPARRRARHETTPAGERRPATSLSLPRGPGLLRPRALSLLSETTCLLPAGDAGA